MNSSHPTYIKSTALATAPHAAIEALGQSNVFLDFQDQLSSVAVVNRPVLILGERGTGKELSAMRLHYLSRRWQGPLVALNCAALASSLLESELFGHEKGAFTGAIQKRTGRFESAHGGTLFLDEIGTLPLEVQEKILRVVEYGGFERVGGSTTIEADVRIVAATNADLKELVKKGRFKQDLLDRLSFEVLYLPPLRARSDDIMLLANHFAARMAYELEMNEMPRFSKTAEQALIGYAWPGNIRELKNVVERALYRSENGLIEKIIFDPFASPFTIKSDFSDQTGAADATRSSHEPDLDALPFKAAVWEFKKRLLQKTLAETRFNQTEAARKLGLSYHQFRGLFRAWKEENEKVFLKR